MWLSAHRVVIGFLAVALLAGVQDVEPREGVGAPRSAAVEVEPWGTRQTLARDGFFRVATDGNTVAAHDRGVVEVFARSGAEWSPTQAVDVPGFSWAFDVHGGVLAIGWVNYDPNAAAVALFELRDGRWEHAAELENLEAFSVAVWGDTVAVAGLDLATWDHGVYVYERNGSEWERTATLMPSGGGCYPNAVGLWRNRLVIEVFHSHDPCDHWPDWPAPFVYRRQGGSWVEEQRLTPTRGDAMFGKSVAIWGDTIVVGDPIQERDPPAERLPKVRIYEWDGERWSRTQVIKRFGHAFGGSVALHKDTLVIGDTDQGGAWVYTRVDGRFRLARRLPKGGLSVAVWGPVVLNAGPGLFTERPGRVDAYRLVRCHGLVPTVVGTHEADRLVGTAHGDVIVGGRGDDRIDAGEGSDVVCGKGGADLLKGRHGADYLIGGFGNDVLRGGTGHDNLYGSAGDDSIYGGPGNDYLDGGVGTDSCVGETLIACE